MKAADLLRLAAISRRSSVKCSEKWLGLGVQSEALARENHISYEFKHVGHQAGLVAEELLRDLSKLGPLGLCPLVAASSSSCSTQSLFHLRDLSLARLTLQRAWRLPVRPLPWLGPVVALGGPWDLVTTYNWAYNPTYNPPKWSCLNYK